MPAKTKKPPVKKFKDTKAVLSYVEKIYGDQVEFLRKEFESFAAGKRKGEAHVSGYYPYIEIAPTAVHRLDSRLSYGFVPRAGRYRATLTRLDLFKKYYAEQISLLIENHNIPIQVGLSDVPIPVHFALGENYHLEKKLSPKQIQDFPFLFDVPDLETLDDEVANGTFEPKPGEAMPLSLFSAPRVDLSLQRLKHYTGTSPKHFQNFVIFTNYQFYIDGFIELAQEMMKPAKGNEKKTRQIYTEFVEPGDRVTRNANLQKVTGEAHVIAGRMPQMPAYHLKMNNHMGITMINIGVGPSNAKTITDHLSVLRPHAWLMLGHCAGLRNSQKLGDYVLAHGYLREDKILDEDLPPSIPLPALSEIQKALENAVGIVTGLKGFDLKSIMRTGTVATTADRNWELRPFDRQNRRLSQSRAIAMDMESGTIAANGFRFRVPYGTLLCVSDKPLHGQLKLPGMANAFYRERVEQHLKIGILAMSMLRDLDRSQLHSRKLRSFNEVAFQ